MPGVNDSIAWGQEKEASILHDVAVQADKLWTELWQQVGVDSMFPELEWALTHTEVRY